MFNFKKQSTKELVAEIHETFYTEADRLLEQALKKKAAVISNVAEYEKGKSLSSLGFGLTPSATKFKETEERRLAIENENAMKDSQRETILYFQQKYPNHKYISVDGVKRICAKYGLIFGSVERFTGDVPAKNLEEILKAKIDESDLCYLSHKEGVLYWSIGENGNFIIPPPEPCGYLQFENKKTFLLSNVSYTLAPLEIAAPQKDFNTEGMDLKDFELKSKPVEIPDPVVLQPVWHNDSKHYLILTAWGDEASDELVVNEKMN